MNTNNATLEIDNLKAENEKLKMEIAILKKELEM